MTHTRKPGLSSARLTVEGMEDRITPAAGDLDPLFGTNGVVSVAFPNVSTATTLTQAFDSAVQADGKIVLVGTEDPQIGGTFIPSQDFAIVRLTPGGALDQTFGTNGMVTVDFGVGASKRDTARAVAIQSDGKIVVAGRAGNTPTTDNWAITRLNTDGSVDTTFGVAGRRSFVFTAAGSGVDDIVIQPDGRIVLVGTQATLSTQLQVARLTNNGTLDTTFGPTFNGMMTVPIPVSGVAGPTRSASAAITLQPDGKIVVAGAVENSKNDFTAARLLSNGTLDPGFGVGGIRTVGLSTTAAFTGVLGGVALQADGSIVLAGGKDTNQVLNGGDFTAVRLTPAGALDGTFGSGGIAFVPFDLGGLNTDIAEGVVIQPDGKIVLGGYAQTASSYVFAAARLNRFGTIDSSFGTGGKRTYSVPLPATSGNMVGAHDTIFVSGGKILLVGSDTQRMAAVQLLNDTSFNPLPPGGGSINSLGVSLLAAAAEGGLVSAFGISTPGVYNPAQQLNFNAFPEFQGFAGVIRTATGDVDGDTIPDFALVTGPGTPTRFAVVSGKDQVTYLIAPSFPFRGSESFDGGGFVSVADIDRDGRAEIVISADQGGGPRVVVFSDLVASPSPQVRADFFGIADPNFRGGARTAMGDVNGDGVADLAVAAGEGGGPRIALYSGATLFTTRAKLVNDFFAFDNVLRDGAYVAIGDVNGDGFGDLVFGAGAGGAPRVLIVSGQRLLTSTTSAFSAPIGNFFVAGDTTSRGGVRVATKNVDNDSQADVVVGSGEGQPSRVRVYLGNSIQGREPTTFQDLDPFGFSPADGVYVG